MGDFDRFRLASGMRWGKGPFDMVWKRLATLSALSSVSHTMSEGALSLAQWLLLAWYAKQNSTEGNHSGVLRWHTMAQREDQKTKEGETVPEGRIISSREMLKKKPWVLPNGGGMCQYDYGDGGITQWQMVHLGSEKAVR